MWSFVSGHLSFGRKDVIGHLLLVLGSLFLLLVSCFLLINKKSVGGKMRIAC